MYFTSTSCLIDFSLGFLIVSYMVDKMDCSVEAALMAFAQARPPGIYKEDYIKELFRRYGDEEDALPAPELPQWCNSGQYNCPYSLYIKTVRIRK